MSYLKLQEYLQHLEENYHVEVCIKDYCGFIPINKELDQVLQPYLAHVNPFCMYIKHERKKYWDCLSMIRKMYRKFEDTPETFFGVCHAGLGEIVVPVANDDMLLGSVNVGFFPVEQGRSYHRIEKTCQNSKKLKVETALRLFDEHIKTPTVSPKALVPMMEVVAEYLALTYENLQSAHDAVELTNRHHSSNEDTIISHATQMIHENYHKQLQVAAIAKQCHCSESHLSRVFKKRIGLNLNTYINKIRIEYSKSYLISTEESMADISMKVGFNDPNYFSRVFSNMTGIPPSEFRRRFSETGDAIKEQL